MGRPPPSIKVLGPKQSGGSQVGRPRKKVHVVKLGKKKGKSKKTQSTKHRTGARTSRSKKIMGALQENLRDNCEGKRTEMKTIDSQFQTLDNKITSRGGGSLGGSPFMERQDGCGSQKKGVDQGGKNPLKRKTKN